MRSSSPPLGSASRGRSTVNHESTPPENNAALWDPAGAREEAGAGSASIGTSVRCRYHDRQIRISSGAWLSSVRSTGAAMRSGSRRVTASGRRHASHAFPERLSASACSRGTSNQ